VTRRDQSNDMTVINVSGLHGVRGCHAAVLPVASTSTSTVLPALPGSAYESVRLSTTVFSTPRGNSSVAVVC
jgi:hypothetical protein